MKKIDKPWGFEEIIEHNEYYVLKKLCMNKGHKCSVQFHRMKKETVYLLSGSLNIYIGDARNDLAVKPTLLKPNDSLTIEPGVVHRMEAVEDSIYLEASTPELDDVVRLSDEYGRVG